MFLSIIIPTYNEDKIIKKNIIKIQEYFNNKFEFEIIIVNDGSTDNTESVLLSLKISNLKLINNKNNYGKGRSIRQGIKECVGDIILLTDADLSSPIDEFEKLYKIYNNNYDFVIGSRSRKDSEILKKQNFKRILAGKIFNIFIKILLQLNYKDTQCGFKLFKKNKIKKIMDISFINRFCIDVEILFIAKKLNYKVYEKGIVWENNTDSSVSLIKDSISMFIDLIKIRLRKYNLQ